MTARNALAASTVAATLLTVVAFNGCGERPTKVRLEGGRQTLFVLSGSGALSFLRVYGPQQRSLGSDLNYVIWEIEPIEGPLEGKPVEQLRRIQYGVVPNGYKQKYPEQGAPPPDLEPGQTYEYWLETTDAPRAHGYFEIRDGRAVELAER